MRTYMLQAEMAEVLASSVRSSRSESRRVERMQMVGLSVTRAVCVYLVPHRDVAYVGCGVGDKLKRLGANVMDAFPRQAAKSGDGQR